MYRVNCFDEVKHGSPELGELFGCHRWVGLLEEVFERAAVCVLFDDMVPIVLYVAPVAPYDAVLRRERQKLESFDFSFIVLFCI